MKKKLGIFSVAIIAGTMLFNANLSNNTKSDINLTSLIVSNVANAETIAFGCKYTGSWSDTCTYGSTSVIRCTSSSTTSCQF